MKSGIIKFVKPLILLLVFILQVSAADPVQVIGKYLCINYQPFFPIGLYSFPDKRQDDAMWKESADAGFNFVLSENSGKYGIYVSKAIPWKSINGNRVSIMELYRDQSLLVDLKDFIAKNENDPTMLCWHAPDEPSYFGPSAASIRLGYQAIKDNSKKPVWLNIGPSFTQQVYNYNKERDFYRACDILSEDIYPIPEGKPKPNQSYNQYPYFVGEHTKKLVESGSIEGVQNTPIWMVLQGFGWGDLNPGDNSKDFPPPNLHELRYMTYDAIIHGATGILFWGLGSGKTKTNTQLWNDLKAIATELREMYTVLTCPFEILPDKIKITTGDPSGQDNPIHCLIKLLDNKVCVLAINTRNVPLKNVSFNLVQGGVLTKVNVVRENRQVQISNKNSWTDEFEGYGVHIYETDIYFSFMRRYYKDPTIQPK